MAFSSQFRINFLPPFESKENILDSMAEVIQKPDALPVSFHCQCNLSYPFITVRYKQIKINSK